MHRDTGPYTADKVHQKMLMFVASLKERIGKAALCTLSRRFPCGDVVLAQQHPHNSQLPTCYHSTCGSLSMNNALLLIYQHFPNEL